MRSVIFDRRAWYRRIYRAIRRKGTLAFREALMPHGIRNTRYYDKVLHTPLNKKEFAKVHKEELKWQQIANAMTPDNAGVKEMTNSLLDLLERREDLRGMMADFLEGKYEE